MAISNYKAQGRNPPPDYKGPEPSSQPHCRRDIPQEPKPEYNAFKYFYNHIEPAEYATEVRDGQVAPTQKFRGFALPPSQESDATENANENENEDTHVLANLGMDASLTCQRPTANTPLIPAWFYAGDLSRLRERTVEPIPKKSLDISFTGFTIRPSPGKGKGFYSKTQREAAEVMLVELPILVNTKAVATLGREQDYLALFNRLPESHKSQFLELHNEFSAEGNTSIYQQICRSNEIEIPLFKDGGEGHGYTGVFPKLARVNHSCSPNAVWRFNPLYFAVELRAVRPIKKNEEVTVSYIDPCQPRAARQQQLSEKYGFRCGCSKCEEGDATESDKHRSSLADWPFGHLTAWSMNLDLPKEVVLKEIIAGLDMVKAEGLESHAVISKLYGELVGIYIEAADEEMVKKCAAAAALYLRAKQGVNGNEPAFQKKYDDLLVLQKHPEASALWGKRIKRTQQFKKLLEGDTKTLEDFGLLGKVDVKAAADVGPMRTAIMLAAASLFRDEETTFRTLVLVNSFIDQAKGVKAGEDAEKD